MVLAVLVLGLPESGAEQGPPIRNRRRVRVPDPRDPARRLPHPGQLRHADRRRLSAVAAVSATSPRTPTPRNGARRRRREPWLGLSAFWATVVQGRAHRHRLRHRLDPRRRRDVDKLWVIITGGILGVIAMRLVIGQLLVLVNRYPAARGRRVHHHRVGRHQADAGVPARRRVGRASRSRNGSRSACRGDLRDRVRLREVQGPSKATRRRKAEDLLAPTIRRTTLDDPC